MTIMKIILIKRKYSCELPSCGRPQDCKTESPHKICGYHHIDYGVIQGFPRKEKKAVTTLVKKYDIFSRVSILPIKCWHVTRVSHHWSGWWKNGKSFTIFNPWLFCRNVLGLWLLKHGKIRIAYFPRRGRKPKYKKKNRSYVFRNGFRLFRASIDKAGAAKTILKW